jgi:hypothetical protein
MTRTRITIAAGIAIVLIAGALLTRRRTPTTTTAAPAAAAVKPAAAVVDGRGDPSAVGARETAVEYVSTVQTDAVHAGPVKDRPLLARWLDPAVDVGEVDRAVAQLADARMSVGADGGQIVWLVVPLGTRVEALSVERARVSVWVVRVVASGTPQVGGVRPVAGWSTLTVDLSWRENRWWVWSLSSLPGPAPMLSTTVAPSTAADFAARLAGFELSGASS